MIFFGAVLCVVFMTAEAALWHGIINSQIQIKEILYENENKTV